jgi:mRNA interferase RelE/StbE
VVNQPHHPVRYKIVLHKDVVAVDSKRFDAKTKNKIKMKCIELLSFRPDEVGQPLRAPLQGYRKLKIFSDYRVIYRVEKERVIVFILAVGIRRDFEVYEIALKRLGQ